MAQILFLKAQSIPPGSRWITLHPNGADAKGQPVLIQPNPDGSAHVIGGAGGALNFLKLRAVRSESDYKREAAEKKQAATEAKKEQRKRDKENGLVESKKKAREGVRAQVRDHERQFVQTVAEAMGWDPKSLEFPEQDVAHLSDEAQARLRIQHNKELLARANEAVDAQRRRLVDDASARMEGGIGELPLETADPEMLSVQDLAPVKAEGGGLGFAPGYKERAEEAGLSDEELQAEAGAAKEAKQAAMTPAQRQAAVQRGETAKMVADEIKSIREPLVKDVKVELADAKAAVALLKAQKQLKQIQKKARDANRGNRPRRGRAEGLRDGVHGGPGRRQQDRRGHRQRPAHRADARVPVRVPAPGRRGARGDPGQAHGVGAYNSVNSAGAGRRRRGAGRSQRGGRARASPAPRRCWRAGSTPT
jgi:hypothetical protein